MVQTLEEICKQKIIDNLPQSEIDKLPKTLQNEMKQKLYERQFTQIIDFISRFFDNAEWES